MITITTEIVAFIVTKTITKTAVSAMTTITIPKTISLTRKNNNRMK